MNRRKDERQRVEVGNSDSHSNIYAKNAMQKENISMELSDKIILAVSNPIAYNI